MWSFGNIKIMGIEVALTALLGSGVIEKGILVWMIIQFNQQANAISEIKNKVSFLAESHEKDIVQIKIELATLQKDVEIMNDRFRDVRAYLGMKRQQDTKPRNTEPSNPKQ
jgi:TolA-binding protein